MTDKLPFHLKLKSQREQIREKSRELILTLRPLKGNHTAAYQIYYIYNNENTNDINNNVFNLECVYGYVEEADELGGVWVQHHYVLRPGLLDHVRNQLRRDR